MDLTVLSMFVLLLFGPLPSCPASEFNLDGDYLIGGIFPVHYTPHLSQTKQPGTVNCLEKPLFLKGYRGLQVMRFAVEEINNSSTLLPNVTLGYHLFDHCTDAQNFPDILQLFSVNGSVKTRQPYTRHHSQVIGFIGPFSSTETISLAPMFMMDLVPMISYGATSSTLSDKSLYPSFIRTTPSNRNQIKLIIHIIKHFGWNWVAFIGSKSDYSENGFQLFTELVGTYGICLGYQELLSDTSKWSTTLHKIDKLNINVIVLFIDSLFAEQIITSSAQLNVYTKVWIASDSWSMNNNLLRLKGITSIGTVIGVTPTVVPLSGFDEFIYQSQNRSDSVHSNEGFCNQDCDNCSSVNPEDIINENPTYNFPIYSAVYTLAKALDDALQCSQGFNRTCAIYPYTLLEEIKHLQFPLNEYIITFDKSLDPPARYSIVFWDTSHQPVMIRQIGSYTNYPVKNLTIHKTHLHWHGSGQVPFSNCSVECQPGHVRQQDGPHQCCFTCMKCPSFQYANHTANLYSCLNCDKWSEWSDVGSTMCQKRSREYLHFSDGYAIFLMVCASFFILLCVGVAVLFANHRSTPVVRSAGGSMCFLMLGCLGASAISTFFYFREPTAFSCVTRDIVFAFFYTVCLSCLYVRSFQIICIFKMAAHLPKAHAWWVKHNGQWLVVAAISLFQLLLCVIWIGSSPPLPNEDISSFKDQIVLKCISDNATPSRFVVAFMWLLSGLCFCFSYMGTDLPKNYNEAKAITFSMLLFSLSWASFYTASLISKTKYVQVVNIVVELICLYGIMFSYFIPKSFIIVFQPMKNTQEYFQASIQSYTQTISKM